MEVEIDLEIIVEGCQVGTFVRLATSHLVCYVLIFQITIIFFISFLYFFFLKKLFLFPDNLVT